MDGSTRDVGDTVQRWKGDMREKKKGGRLGGIDDDDEGKNMNRDTDERF